MCRVVLMDVIRLLLLLLLLAARLVELRLQQTVLRLSAVDADGTGAGWTDRSCYSRRRLASGNGRGQCY